MRSEWGPAAGPRTRCPRDVLAWIPLYADDDLTRLQKKIVEIHATGCRECRAELDLVLGGSLELDAEWPDSRRLFRAIMARVAAGEVDALISLVPVDRFH